MTFASPSAVALTEAEKALIVGILAARERAARMTADRREASMHAKSSAELLSILVADEKEVRDKGDSSV